MNKLNPPSLKTIFLIHVFVAGLNGLVLLLIPEQNGALIGMTVTEPFVHRLLGATWLSSIAYLSWLGYKAETWEQVIATLKMEMFFPFLLAVVVLWALLAGAFPPYWWLNFAILVVFGSVFTRFYLKYRSE